MLDALEKILDINFKPDININILNFTKIEGEDRFQADGRTLHLNIEELEPEQLRELQQLPQDQFDEKDRVLREDVEDETQAIESGYDEEMDEILDYFEPILTEKYHSILEQSLHLKSLISERDLSKEEIQERKWDIGRRFGPEAVYISSLTSAGYFDPDGGLRNLFLEMGLNKQYDKLNFQQELEDLVERKLLCVFVESDDDVLDVTNEVRGRLSRYQDVDPIHGWHDLRGIGGPCEDIIDLVMENLEEEFIGIDYDRWTDGDKLIVRIHPQSLPPIGS